jgi:hypothetical protein
VTPRSLADDLRQRDEASLALLLRRRPDLSHPVPQDITALAARATTGPSLSRCLDALNLIELHLLALTARLSRSTPTTVDAVLEGQLDKQLAKDTLADLRTLALIWGPENSLRVVTGVHDLLASLPRTSDEVSLTEPTAWQPLATTSPARGNPDTIAATIARRFVLGVDVLVQSWGQRPVRALAKGGLPAKDLANLQALLEWEVPAVVLGLEVARAARLITRDADQRWLPTQQFDRWLAKDVGQRWVALFEAWLDLPKVATAPQVVPLDDTQSPGVIAVRRASLEILAQAPTGTTVSVDGVCAVLDFRFPRRRGQVRNQMVQASLLEANLLGVIVDSSLTRAGRAALEPDAASPATCIQEDLPELAAGFFIQSDLTIIAPGPLPLTVEAMVRRIAQVESAEPATVARITANSLSEAVSSGLTMAEVDEFLQRHSLVPLPQSLGYLISDTARRCAEEPPEIQSPQRAATPKVAALRVSRLQDRIPDLARALANSTRVVPTDQASSPPVVGTEPSADVLANVRAAIDQSEPIWVAFAEADGVQITTLMDPIRVESGAIVAMDLSAGRIRTIATARITGTAPQATATR